MSTFLEGKMETNKKPKTTNVAVCLKAIKDYVEMDEKKVLAQEKDQLKDRAQKAMTHLSMLLSPEVKNVSADPCPAGGLPTIE